MSGAVAHRADRAAAASPVSILATSVRLEQRMFWRNRSGAFFTLAVPLLLLAFLGMFANPHTLVPGLAAVVVVSAAFQTLCIQLSYHREQGVLKRLLATPAPTWVFAAAKLATATIVVALEVAVVAVAGWLVLDVPLPADVLATTVAIVAGCAAFVALAFVVASLIRNADSAPSVATAVELPMLFISGVFYPVGHLPEIVQWLAAALPLYHVVQLLHAGWFGAGDLLPHLLVLGVWALAGGVWAAARFRWEPVGEG